MEALNIKHIVARWIKYVHWPKDWKRNGSILETNSCSYWHPCLYPSIYILIQRHIWSVKDRTEKIAKTSSHEYEANRTKCLIREDHQFAPGYWRYNYEYTAVVRGALEKVGNSNSSLKQISINFTGAKNRRICFRK